MKLYVGPLPNNATHRAVKAFFKGFEKNVQIQIRHLNHDDDEPITYAHISVASDRMAKKIVKRLNGTMLKGKPVLVREFISRASGNDRRSLGWRGKPWKFFDRRDIDRRKTRTMQVMEDQWMVANREHSPFQSDEKSSTWLKQRKAV